MHHIEKKENEGLEIIAYSEKPCKGYATIQNKISLGKFESPLTIDLSEIWNFTLENKNSFLLNHWKIRTDENEIGISKEWHKPEYDDTLWRSVNVGPLSSYFDAIPNTVSGKGT